MQKKPLQDVIPPRQAGKRPARQAPVEETPPQQPPRRSQNHRTERSRGPGRGIWVVAIVSLIVLGLALSFLFSDSKVIAYPKNRSTVVTDTAFEAFRSPSAGQLGFDVMSLERTATQSVEATGEEEVSSKASGKIIIFNTHSEASQRLIKDTRFETTDGLIYRISEAIVVPGQKTVDGELVPGQIEVTVHADQPGEEYNIGLEDFTIPGFAGSPRFETFFARSATPMTGGFDGTRKTVAGNEKAKTETELAGKLREEIIAEAKAQRPDGFLLYDDAIFIDTESFVEESDGDTVTIGVRASLSGILFDAGEFASFLAANTVAGYDNEEVYLEDPASITLNILEKEAVRPAQDDRISFSVRGPVRIVWAFDGQSFARDLAGKAKAALPTVLSGYPAIERAEPVLRPIWRRSFPDDPADIVVVQKLDE